MNRSGGMVKSGACAIACFLILSTQARAQGCSVEIEPNNTPLEASLFDEDACITGSLSPGDQDLFLWAITEQDLQGKWVVFDLESIPGHLTTMLLTRLELNELGQSTSRQDLLTLTTSDGSRVSQELSDLEPGTYYIGLSASGGEGSYTLNIRLVEPTNIAAEATPLDDSLGTTGTFAESGKAIYTFTTSASGLYRVQVLGNGVQSVAYYDSSGAKLKEESGRSPLRLDDLALPAGTHYLELRGVETHILKVIPLGPVPQGTALLGSGQQSSVAEPAAPSVTQPSSAGPCIQEAEPNNARAEATALASLACFSGQLSEGDTDYYTFVAGADAAQKRLRLAFTASAPSFITVVLEDGEGNQLQSRYFNQQTSLSDLVLTEGVYALSISARDTTAVSYQVQVIEEGAAPVGFEHEPNDRFQDATTLGNSTSIQGRMVGDDDDVFLLEVEGEPQLWRFEALGAGLRSIVYLDGSGREVLRRTSPGDTETIQMSNVFMLPGKNYVMVRGTDATYTLRAIPLGPPDAAGTRPAGTNEREPNDDQTRAELLQFNETRVGLLGEADDLDIYRFTLYAPETVRLEVIPGNEGGVGARINDIGDRYHNAEVGETTIIEADLLPGDHYVQLHATHASNSYYQVQLSRPKPATAADLEIEAVIETSEVAAYWHEGQRATGEVTITNRGSAARQLSLEALSSHYGWQPLLETSSLTLHAGQSQAVPMAVNVLPDARDDQPVQLMIRAQEAEDIISATALELSAVCTAPPIDPQLMWPVPAPLLGGLNVAWSGLGGRLVDEADANSASLIDGLVSPATGWSANIGQSVTIELAGDQTTEIAGFLLNPYGRLITHEKLKAFEIAVSTDGRTFDTVLAAELSAASTEQGFVLERPTSARFVRLTALNAHRANATRTGLGEFKVIASSTSRPLGAQELNLVAPDVGGYVVWSNPFLSDAGRLLEVAAGNPNLYTAENTSLSWAVGFHNNRAAQIAALEWLAYPSEALGELIGSVDIAVSLSSPVGPWQSLGSWNTSEPRFELTALEWVRFVRFTAEGLAPRTNYRLPGSLRILERPTDSTYRSAVGEWGQSQRAAIYEHLASQTESQALQEADDNDSQQTAQVLSSGQLVEGQVVIGEDVDWYKMTVPAGENMLEVTLAAEPTLNVVFELVDAQGKPVFYEQSGSQSQVTLTATVPPGDYFLRLEEPPRSVVFAWDNSGSMGPYLDIIYQTVANFVQDVEVGREVVQLLPFTDDPSGKFLLQEWSGDPYELMATLNNYDRSDGSSSAETSLLAATEALGDRLGTRAVLFMTDAESSSYHHTDELWAALAEVQPRVFTLETSSAGSAYTQDLMQSWADAAGGFYDYARTVGDFDIAFARATCHLRRPTRYRVRVETRYETPPGPGSVSVVRAGGSESNAPVEIILDASGSMNKKLVGEARIEIAKRVLLDLTEDILPASTPFALRVFGHREPNSCRTDLEIPLSPLDPAVVRALMPRISPKLLSGTPIAESLLQAASDLQISSLPKTIILLTDGEESCGGDVEAAIEQLMTLGIMVQLSVIGFTDAEEEAKMQFRRWAELGGGQFLEAGNADELRTVLEQALTPPFEVLDAEGHLVASGRVGGESVPVPAGVYTVQVADEVFENVRVPGERAVQLTLAQP